MGKLEELVQDEAFRKRLQEKEIDFEAIDKIMKETDRILDTYSNITDEDMALIVGN